MATERPSGHYLEKRIGGGDSRSAYSGSLFLADAQLRNSHLDQLGVNEHIERERDATIKGYLRRRNSVRDELSKLEKDKQKLTYFQEVTRALNEQLFV